MAVFKATITITVLLEADSPAKAAEPLSRMSLASIGTEMADGEFIGQFKITALTKVASKDVREELLAVGNDGDFFESCGPDKREKQS